LTEEGRIQHLVPRVSPGSLVGRTRRGRLPRRRSLEYGRCRRETSRTFQPCRGQRLVPTLAHVLQELHSPGEQTLHGFRSPCSAELRVLQESPSRRENRAAERERPDDGSL